MPRCYVVHTLPILLGFHSSVITDFCLLGFDAVFKVHEDFYRLWSLEDEGDMFLQNVRNHLPSDTMSRPRTLESSVLIFVVVDLW